MSDFWRTWNSSLGFFSSLYILLVPLPLYLSALAISDLWIGIILGTFGLAAMLSRPIAGALADKYERKKVMLLGSVMLAVSSFSYSLTIQPALLLIVRIVHASSYALFTTGATALAADLSPPERRASNIAVFGASANVAITFVPSMVDWMLPVISLRGTFIIAALVALLSMLVISNIKVPKKSDEQKLQNTSSVWELYRSLNKPFWSSAVFGTIFFAYFQFMPLLAERRGIEGVGYIYTLYGIAIILTRFFLGKYLDGEVRHKLVVGGFFAHAIGLLGLSIANQFVSLGAMIVLLAIGSGLLHPGLISIHIEQAGIELRGRATALFYLAFDLGIGAGSLFLSLILNTYGISGFYVAASLIAIVGTILAFRLPTKQIPMPKSVR